MSASIQQQLQALNYSFEIIYDQSFHTVKCDDGRKVWYIAEESATHKVVTLEDWKTGERHTLKEGTGSLSPEERAKHAVSIRLAQEQAAKVALSRLSELHYGPSPYLNRKGLHTTLPMLVDQGLTYMPITEASGSVTSFQSISEYGDKTFHVGGKTHGCVGVVKKPHRQPSDVVCLLGEGLSTVVASYEACSIFLPSTFIQPFTVLSAKNYAEAVLRLWEAGYRRFILVADHDIGLETNPGLLAAKEAESLCKELQASCMVVLPDSIDEKSTDMCDVVAARGLSEAAKLFWGAEVLFVGLSSDGGLSEDVSIPSEASIEVSTHSPSPKPTLAHGDGLRLPPCQYDYSTFTRIGGTSILDTLKRGYLSETFPSLPRTRTDKGKLAQVEPDAVVNCILRVLGDRLVVSGSDFFYFNNLYWQHLDSEGEGFLVRTISQLSYGKYSHSKDLDTLNKLRSLTRRADVNLFDANFTKINFLNGTLHLSGTQGNYALSFYPHNKEDYCTNVLPYPYTGDTHFLCNEFDLMLGRIFGKDKHCKDKIRLLAQVFGACLMPVYPQFILFLGRSGSGKSTIIKLIREFLHSDNVGSLAPTLFHGFHLEPLIGKLVNVCSDIPTQGSKWFTGENDGVMKQILDRDVVVINRKYKTAMAGRLPSVHLFAGNNMPESLEGGTSQMSRRWTFINFDSSVVSGEDIHFTDKLLDTECLGVLAFALRGLVDLLANRGFSKVEMEQKELMDEWGEMSCSVMAFWKEVRDVGIKVQGFEDSSNGRLVKVPLSEGSVSSDKVYKIYQSWCQESGFLYPVSKIGFCRKSKSSDMHLTRKSTERIISGVKIST